MLNGSLPGFWPYRQVTREALSSAARGASPLCPASGSADERMFGYELRWSLRRESSAERSSARLTQPERRAWSSGYDCARLLHGRTPHMLPQDGSSPRILQGAATEVRIFMDAQIRISSDDAVDDYAALRKWLTDERELAGRVRLVQRLPEEGELGGAYEMISVALGAGGAVGVMVRSLVAWLQGRRSDVEITVSSPAGSVAKLSARRIKDADLQSLLQEVRAALPVDDES